jgi:cell division protein FtsB
MVGLSLIALLAVTAIVGDGGWLHIQRLTSYKQAMEEKNRQLEREIVDLDAQATGLEQGTEGVERVARTDLNMALPGEKVFVIPADQEGEK